jgi:hypothetical protein
VPRPALPRGAAAGGPRVMVRVFPPRSQQPARRPSRIDRQALGSLVGLRPLIRSRAGESSARSREFRVFDSPSGLLPVAGGKDTTYRHTAEVITDMVADRLGWRRLCRTRHFPLDETPKAAAGAAARAVCRRASRAQGPRRCVPVRAHGTTRSSSEEHPIPAGAGTRVSGNRPGRKRQRRRLSPTIPDIRPTSSEPWGRTGRRTGLANSRTTGAAVTSGRTSRRNHRSAARRTACRSAPPR